ncbi:MAG: mechanosensitive ion channel [Candidatus Latescibacteria bacterium]|nr:mechanosensitive ion channel [Candidatus Latescibacterota bacterium]
MLDLLLSLADLFEVSTESTPVDSPSASIIQRLADLFEISAQSSLRKVEKIGVVFLILLGSKFLMDVVSVFSRRIITSPRGPLRYLFPHGKRSLTINSLLINIIRYALYFTAFGYILSELGIDYRAYIASLSVIGLAVGFGAQGLVQDIVTGFFIIFEGHFDVGDLVDIGGQVGIVEEIGLRVTRLRNHLGEEMIFPNRNISTVGNFVDGGIVATIDVAVADDDAEATRAAEFLQTLGRELAVQFHGTILSDPHLSDPLLLSTGERFVRLHTTIWPAQQWVIENQLVPRIRELLQREGLAIPSDRIAVFYHAGKRAIEEPQAFDTIRKMLRSG